MSVRRGGKCRRGMKSRTRLRTKKGEFRGRVRQTRRRMPRPEAEKGTLLTVRRF